MNQSRQVLHRAKELLEQHEPVTLVSVAAARGSTPRETGTLMIVSMAETAGTIGGGELEHQAIQQARTMLDQAQFKYESTPFERQFALGSNCGQCCGGVVTLAFQTLQTVPEWLLQTLTANTPAATIAVFGAGHVGRALVDVLAKLDLQIIWVDQRKPQFPASVPDNVLVTPHPQPAAFAAQLPASSLCLVMTHSHSLDFDICSQLLARADIPFCGLIGSQSKRRRFEGLLRQGGLDDYIPRLTCPIGIEDIPGKSPYEIGVSVSAQILTVLATADAATETPSAALHR